MFPQLKCLRSLPLMVLGLLILSSCASKDKDIKSKQASLYFGAGTQSLVDQNYTDALTSLLKANELEPNNSEILNNLGMAYFFKGEKDLAVKHLLASIKINNNNSDARLNLASIYVNDGELRKAEELYKIVLKDLTYDKQARTLYNLGILELEHKRNSLAAEDYFKRSLKEDMNYCPSSFQLGRIQFSRKQFNTALRNFREASLGTCTNSPAGPYYHALTLIELKRFNEARLKLEEVQTRFKDSAYAVKARAKAVELNDIEERYKAVEAMASRKVLESPDF